MDVLALQVLDPLVVLGLTPPGLRLEDELSVLCLLLLQEEFLILLKELLIKHVYSLLQHS